MSSARTPEECSRLFAERLNAADVEGVVALYESGATLVLEGQTAAVGRDAIRTAIARFAEAQPEIRCSATRVIRGSDDLAVVYNDWSLTAKTPGGVRRQDSGHAIEIMRRQTDGSWRFLIDDPRGRG
jgi:uncharacterized protein (TIGR02246 family)